MVEIGTKIRAVSDCQMRDGSGPALIIGKIYKVFRIVEFEDDPDLNFFQIVAEKGNHGFDFFQVLKEGEVLEDFHLFELVKEGDSDGN